jgi:hypothetical protein
LRLNWDVKLLLMQRIRVRDRPLNAMSPILWAG